jgi:hypothetical protein
MTTAHTKRIERIARESADLARKSPHVCLLVRKW